MRESASPASRMFGGFSRRPVTHPAVFAACRRRYDGSAAARSGGSRQGRREGRLSAPDVRRSGTSRTGQSPAKGWGGRVAGPAASTPYDVVAMRSRMDLPTPGEPCQLLPCGSASPRAARAVTSSATRRENCRSSDGSAGLSCRLARTTSAGWRDRPAHRPISGVPPGRNRCQSDPMIETWLTRTFSLSVPVVGAPMAGPGEGALAAAVSAAGGLGMIGVQASRSPRWVLEQAVVAAEPGRPYGVGLMAWALDQDDRQLEAVLDVRPALVSVSFGAFEPYVERLRAAGIPVTVQAGNVAEAVRAERAGADLVVARGGEGGGHGRNEVGTLPLLQAVLERVGVPVVAAGGIGTARGLAAVLAAGAVGAWVGTALLATREAGTSPAGRARLLAADETDTAYGRVFDVAQGLSWPAEYGGRALRNPFFDRWEYRLDELAAQGTSAELAEAGAGEDYETAYLYAGQGVGLVREERSVAEVLAELASAEDLLRRWSTDAPG